MSMFLSVSAPALASSFRFVLSNPGVPSCCAVPGMMKHWASRAPRRLLAQSIMHDEIWPLSISLPPFLSCWLQQLARTHYFVLVEWKPLFQAHQLAIRGCYVTTDAHFLHASMESFFNFQKQMEIWGKAPRFVTSMCVHVCTATRRVIEICSGPRNSVQILKCQNENFKGIEMKQLLK